MEKEKCSALIGLNIGTFVMSIAGLFAKLITWPAMHIILGRMVLTTPFLVIYLLLRKRTIRLRCPKHVWIVCGLGIMMALHWTTYFSAIQASSVAIGILSVFTAPILTTFLEPLFDHTRVRASDIVVALFAFAGIFLMIDDFSFGSGTLLGVLFGVTSAFIVSLRNIWSKCLVRIYSAPTILLWQMIFGALFFSPLLLFTSFSIASIDMQLLLFLSAITAFAHTVTLQSMACIGARATGVIMMVQPVYAILIAIPVLGEVPDMRTIIGGAIVLSAAVFESLRQK